MLHRGLGSRLLGVRMAISESMASLYQRHEKSGHGADIWRWGQLIIGFDIDYPDDVVFPTLHAFGKDLTPLAPFV